MNYIDIYLKRFKIMFGIDNNSFDNYNTEL